MLPTLAQLAQPERIPSRIHEALASVDPDEPHPLNLFRVHWFNGRDRRSLAMVPDHLTLPEELTGLTGNPMLFGFELSAQDPEIALAVSRLEQVELTSTLIDNVEASTVLALPSASVIVTSPAAVTTIVSFPDVPCTAMADPVRLTSSM